MSPPVADNVVLPTQGWCRQRSAAGQRSGRDQLLIVLSTMENLSMGENNVLHLYHGPCPLRNSNTSEYLLSNCNKLNMILGKFKHQTIIFWVGWKQLAKFFKTTSSIFVNMKWESLNRFMICAQRRLSLLRCKVFGRFAVDVYRWAFVWFWCSGYVETVSVSVPVN